MKKNPTLIKFLPLFIFIFAAQFLAAQILWDGGGDGTSWEDAANWAGDMIPPGDSAVAFEIDATVTGTATQHPRINVREGATVTFDLDLTVGDGTAAEHGIVTGANSTVNLAAGRTFTINCPDNKQALPVFNSSDAATLNIAAGAVINIIQASNGINLKSTNSIITNDGTINFMSGVKNGIKSEATFVNNGTININETKTIGIQLKGGTFDNNGTINANKPGNDCIEVLGGSTFTNFGTLELVAKDSAGSSNNPIAVGSDADAGTFRNAPDGVINADGGDKTSGRAVSVNEMGTLTNMGTMTLTGGGDATRFYNRGTSMNGMNAVLDMTDGRANINQGSFTNMGLLISTRGGVGVFTGADTEATNNAFFDYEMSNNFAGGMGTITDNGLAAQDTIDAGTTCMVDIAETAYDWFEGATFVATADATGGVAFPDLSLTTDPVVLTTSLPGVAIMIENICPAATGASSVFSNNIETVELLVYPSLINSGNSLTVELPDLYQSKTLVFELANMTGNLVKSISTEYGKLRTINMDGLGAGMYIIRSRGEEVNLMGKFMVVK